MTREQYLKSKIVENGWKLKDFAKKINMPYTTLLSIVNSSVGGASLDNITKICNGLNIDIENLNPQKRKSLELNNLETKLVKSFREINNEGQTYIIKTMEMAKKNFAIEKSEGQSNKVKEFPKTEINDEEIVSTAQSAAFGDGTELITYTKEEDEELSKLHDRLDEIFKK